MTDAARAELGRPGTLRVGINLGNILLVTGRSASGEPQGVAPDLAAAIAERLGVAVSYVTFDTPGAVADAIADDLWDLCLIAEEPQRAETIAFCDAYVAIEATYLVPAGSSLQSIEAVDRPGIRIAVSDRTASALYPRLTLTHADPCPRKGLPGPFGLSQRDR